MRHYRGMRVLVAENDLFNQDVARYFLEEAGLLPDVVNNGQEAVEQVCAGRYGLILLDIQMPVMNGREAARAIRSLPGMTEIPILAMTANAFDEDRNRCLEAGMNDHISKPVAQDEFYATMVRWLQKQTAANRA